jgi:hypothetical protein
MHTVINIKGWQFNLTLSGVWDGVAKLVRAGVTK